MKAELDADRAYTEHLSMLGYIAKAISRHVPGEADLYRECFPHNLLKLYDEQHPAHEFMVALAALTRDEAAGIVAQLCGHI
jgi:hypothetical protein